MRCSRNSKFSCLIVLVLAMVFMSSEAFADSYFAAWFGTTNVSGYNTATPDGAGGYVRRSDNFTTNTTAVPTSGLIDSSSRTGDTTITVTPRTGYKIKFIKWFDTGTSTSWTPPTGTSPSVWTDVSVTANQTAPQSFNINRVNNHRYMIWVVFEAVAVANTGGALGAWYGSNNTALTGYNNAQPITVVGTPGSNSTGGAVYQKSTSRTNYNLLANGDITGYNTGSDTTRDIRVIPDTGNGWNISSIKYGVGNCTWSTSNDACSNTPADPATWTSVAVGAGNTRVDFTIDINGGQQFFIWVTFVTTYTTRTVTGSVDPSTDASCTPNTIDPSSQSVVDGRTTTFDLSTSSNCSIEWVNFNGTGNLTTGISGTTYTTPVVSGGDKTFVVKFRPIPYTITATTTGDTGCGTISPGSVSVSQGGSQTYTLTVSSACSISHVYITDNTHTTAYDVAPLSGLTYTFSNVQRNSSIQVAFSNIPATAGDTYCQVPPYVAGASGLAPNVLIIFDNSGSMKEYAYASKTYDCTSSSTPCTTFYGYFDPNKMYKVDTANSSRYLENNVTLNKWVSSGNSAPYLLSGNYLNYKHMQRTDILRKALVGGRVSDSSGSSIANGTLRYNSAADKYLKTQNGKIVYYGVNEPKGLVQLLAGKVRFGVMVLNNPNNPGGGRLAAVPNGTTGQKAVLGSSEIDLVKAIDGSETDGTVGGTPTAETLYEATRYFQAKKSAYNNGVDYATIGDPILNACQKHFVLLLTDGEPNNNNDLPGSANSYTDSLFNPTTWEDLIPEADQASNQQSAVCGATTVSYACPSGNNNNGACPNSERMEAVAFYAHNTDLRSSTYSNDVLGNQNLTIFPVYAFGSGAGTKTLQMVAKYGSYNNSNGNGSLTYASPDLQKEWDTDGNCIPDNYYEADDGTLLESKIADAMTSILANVASGTAASILSNSEGSGASLVQAVYYPSKIFEDNTEARWIGEMQNLWFYIDPYLKNSTVREDTDYATSAYNPAHVLDLAQDKVTDFIFDGSQTFVNLYNNTNGDGKTMVYDNSVALDEVKSVWRAGKLLQARTADSRTIHTSTDGVSLLSPTTAGGGFYAAVTRGTALQPYLQTANNDALAETYKVINYIRGTDQAGYRNRKVSLVAGGTASEWKLGDIVSSTPQLQSNLNLNYYHTEYGDLSYKRFITSANYAKRGMVYVGANDGMLHAFKLGKLTTSGDTGIITSGTNTLKIGGTIKAALTGGTDLGQEQWSYIPRNALPYLKYLADVNYKHLIYTDGPITITDVSINKPSACTSTDYADCVKDTINGTNWGTFLIGSMGMGGASATKGNACVTGAAGTCVQTPIYDPADNTNSTGVGYSSYFAFDISNQYFNAGSPSTTLNAQPVFKWEFTPPGLGYATSGATIVRVSGSNNDGSSKVNKNGKWFAVMASGPTGPINTTEHKFLGKSNQNLKIFVIDLGASDPLVLNSNYWVLDSGIPNAFGGSILNASVDTDKVNPSSTGYYQDDVMYLGYTRANQNPLTAATLWNEGGVVRILTKEDPNPANWSVSKVIDGVGSVTGAIDTLQDTAKKKFWLYFGSGRFYYSGDDSPTQRYLFGIQDRCYTTNNVFDKNCNLTAIPGNSPEATGKGAALQMTATVSPVRAADLTDQSTSISNTVTKGWYIALRPEDTTVFNGAERVTSRPSAQTSGSVFYTTIEPTSDVCKYGGTTHLWAVNYENGNLPNCNSLGGTTLIQMTTGAFEQVKFADIFSCLREDGTVSVPPAPTTTDTAKHITRGGGTTPGFASGNTDFRSSGGAPGGSGGDMPPPRRLPAPRKEILHIKEK